MVLVIILYKPKQKISTGNYGIYTSPQKLQYQYGESPGILFLLVNLKHKKVAMDAQCPRCRQYKEDSNHIFRQYPIMDVWIYLYLS